MEEEFQAQGNSETLALELLNSRIQMWINGQQVRGKEITIVSREDSAHQVNAVNWTAKCKIAYNLDKKNKARE
jgi:hypothetical protein